MTVGCMIIACWIPKATNTLLEYVILIAFPVQQWLNEYICLNVTLYVVAHLVRI